MKQLLPLLLLGLLPFSANAESNDLGKERFKEVCMQCHQTSRGFNMVAPPIFGVRDHYLQAYPDKATFVKAVTQWVKVRDEKTSLMSGAIRRFNVMPAVKVSDSDLTAIASFLYDARFNEPAWYKEHFEAEHGKVKN